MLLLALTGYGQTKSGERKMLTDTEHLIRQYQVEAQKGWDANNEALARVYYDSIRSSVIGSFIGAHTFRTLDNKQVKLESLSKPLLLITSATWCAGCVSEIPALNKVAKEYADKVTFIVLFHDTNDGKLLNLAKKYSGSIVLVPSVKKLEDVHTLDIAGFRHILGYPTSYLINTERKIVGFSQGTAVPMTYTNDKGEEVTTTQEQANAINYKSLKEQVEQLLSEESEIKSTK